MWHEEDGEEEEEEEEEEEDGEEEEGEEGILCVCSNPASHATEWESERCLCP